MKAGKKIQLIACIYLVFSLLVGAGCTARGGNITLVNNGKSDYAIVVPRNATPYETKAANKLQKYLEIVSNVKMPIYDDSRGPGTKEILVGKTNRSGSKSIADLQFVKSNPEGFVVKSSGNNLVILGGEKKGVLYGVYTFLEKNIGCKKYTPSFTYSPTKSSIVLTNVSYKEAPAMSVRAENFFRYDEEYNDWHKLQVLEGMPGLEFGKWVLDFYQIVPPDTYFKSHPEYFALRNNKRVPTQLCMSNKEVQQMIVDRLKKEIAANPSAKYWVICQNDNNDYCQCSLCEPKNQAEESPQGSLLALINAVADNFPDKVIGTHAYRYSLRPPKNLQPRKNVLIVVSSLSADRSRPVTAGADRYTVAFRQSYEQWLKKTSNIVVWDYVAQFSNYIAPFPNINILQPNIKYFARGKMLGIFEQASGNHFTDMRELKSYLVAKLLWNPNVNVSMLTKDFITRYYGNASSEVMQYVNSINQNTGNASVPLSVYGKPADAVQSYLSPDAMAGYQALMAQAYDKAGNDAELKKRLDRINITLLYSQQQLMSGTDNNAGRMKTLIQQNASSSRQAHTPDAMKNEIKRIAKENDISVLSEDGKRID